MVMAFQGETMDVRLRSLERITTNGFSKYSQDDRKCNGRDDVFRARSNQFTQEGCDEEVGSRRRRLGNLWERRDCVYVFVNG